MPHLSSSPPLLRPPSPPGGVASGVKRGGFDRWTDNAALTVHVNEGNGVLKVRLAAGWDHLHFRSE